MHSAGAQSQSRRVTPSCSLSVSRLPPVGVAQHPQVQTMPPVCHKLHCFRWKSSYGHRDRRDRRDKAYRIKCLMQVCFLVIQLSAPSVSSCFILARRQEGFWKHNHCFPMFDPVLRLLAKPATRPAHAWSPCSRTRKRAVLEARIWRLNMITIFRQFETGLRLLAKSATVVG